MIDYRAGISILEIVIYFPCLLAASVLVFRHGFGRNSGWIFLVFFALIRIAGSACQLATTAPSLRANIGLYVATFVLSSIGLSPLLLACLGILTRVNYSIADHGRGNRIGRILRLTQLVTTVGFILAIVGGSKSSSQVSSTQVNTLTKVGTALFAVALGGICAIVGLLTLSLGQANREETRIIFGAAASIPFLAVRLVYSLMVVFAHNKNFNLRTGSVTIFLVMAILEEMVVTIIYLVVGFGLRVQPKDDSNTENPRYSALSAISLRRHAAHPAVKDSSVTRYQTGDSSE